MDEKYFDESRVKFHKDFLTKLKLVFKKKIQQVGLENGFFNNFED